MVEFISVEESAGRFSISPKTLYRLIEAGKLSKYILRQHSGRIRLDFEALLEEIRAFGDLWQKGCQGPRKSPKTRSRGPRAPNPEFNRIRGP
jgi:hypothetical protein